MRKDKIAHVHIGKCGGGSINKALNMHGLRFAEFHCGIANEELAACLEKDDGHWKYLISLRDPVARFVSAFNFDKYEKILQRNSKNRLWIEIYNSFPSVNDLLENIWGEDKSLRTLAWKAVTSSRLHMHLGLSWYLSVDLAEALPADRTHIIRTEQMEGDFKAFLEKMGVKYAIQQMPRDKASENFLSKLGIENPLYLSPEATRILRGLLFEDYSILNIFYRRGMLKQPYDY